MSGGTSIALLAGTRVVAGRGLPDLIAAPVGPAGHWRLMLTIGVRPIVTSGSGFGSGRGCGTNATWMSILRVLVSAWLVRHR